MDEAEIMKLIPHVVRSSPRSMDDYDEGADVLINSLILPTL
jgi:hypothetical protein